MGTRTTHNLSILAKHFSDENEARQLLENLRWPNGVVCPHCGGDSPYKLRSAAWASTRKGVWKCRECRKQFTVTVGTIFHASHIPISKWLLAIHILSAAKKSMSAHQLHRMLGVTYRAAWFMAHRLRHAMTQEPMQLTGIVEIDETFIGPRRRRVGRNANWHAKTPVVAMVERGGRARAFPVASVNVATIQSLISREVKPGDGTHIMTDEHGVYKPLPLGYKQHSTVTHGLKEYVRGTVSTNHVEGFFGLLKRGIIGSFHHVSTGHLNRYCDEFAFRYSNRRMSDGARAGLIVAGAEGKRLTYREPSKAAGLSA